MSLLDLSHDYYGTHYWLILLKQCCDLGWYLVYPIVLDTFVFTDPCPRNKCCNSFICEQEERLNTTAL